MPDVRKLQRYLSTDLVKDGDIIKFVDAGRIIPKEFERNGKKETKDILEITVEVHNERKIYTPNKTSQKAVTDSWGHNTEDWIGKECKVLIANQLVFDKIQKIIILEPIK